MTKGSERLTQLSSVILHTDNGVVCHFETLKDERENFHLVRGTHNQSNWYTKRLKSV